MQTYGGVEVQLYGLLTLALDGDTWSASCPVALDRKRSGPQSRPGHNGGEVKKKLCLCRESNPGTPACSHSLACWLSYPASYLKMLTTLFKLKDNDVILLGYDAV
jgi:hypothetical protein